MEPISAWTAVAQNDLEEGILLFEKELKGYVLKVITTCNTLWVVAEWPQGGRIAFRTIFAANDRLEVKSTDESEAGAVIMLKGVTGQYAVHLDMPHGQLPIFRYTTFFKPAFDILMPYCARDIVPMYPTGKAQNTVGTIHTNQAGSRSGQLFFSLNKPETGSVFYFQNLTALNDYCATTETSAGDLVGGEWPEIGFKLPVIKKSKPLPKGKEVIISDAYVLLSDAIPKNDFEVTQQFLNHLSDIYILIQKPDTEYHNWPEIAQKGLKDIAFHKGCWTHGGGHSYLNAYVSDYKTPAEVMVQLAVLLPLIEYCEWTGEDDPLIEDIMEGLPAFYDDNLKVMRRWLPAMASNLDEEEEQKEKGVMDSWYLYHPLMNLARLALKGNNTAKDLLMKSIDYAINAAHHFKYEWPVFYRLETLEVVKRETQPGQGGELDVPGSYAHLMLQVWELTGDVKYFEEAKAAVQKLKGLGFRIFYQANNTAFAAGALLKMYKETKDELYLNLSYSCIAGILRNVQLWECNYGHGEHYRTFFAIFPLNDAPYTAAYEELEVFAATQYYLKEAEDVEILPSVRLLLAELTKYAMTRLPYYYPPMLPQEVLFDEIKTGEIDPKLWVPLEDMQDGWNKSGQVGQEVYGAGVPFGVVPRQYLTLPDAGFMIFVDYPVSGFKKLRGKTATFKVLGDNRMVCRLMILPLEGKKLTGIKVFSKSAKKAPEIIQGNNVTEAAAIFTIAGNSDIKVQW